MPIIRDYINPKELPETADAVIRVTPSGLAEAKIYGENKFSDFNHGVVISRVLDNLSENDLVSVKLLGNFCIKSQIKLRSNLILVNDGKVIGYNDEALFYGENLENVFIIGRGYIRQSKVVGTGYCNGKFNITPICIWLVDSKNIVIDHEVGGFPTTSENDSTPKGPPWSVRLTRCEKASLNIRGSYALEHVLVEDSKNVEVNAIIEKNWDSGVWILRSDNVTVKCIADLTGTDCSNGVEVNTSRNVIVDATVTNPAVHGIWLYFDPNAGEDMYNIDVRVTVYGGANGIYGVENGDPDHVYDISIKGEVYNTSGRGVHIEKASNVDINIIVKNCNESFRYYRLQKARVKLTSISPTVADLYDSARNTGEGPTLSSIYLESFISDTYKWNVYPQDIEYPYKYTLYLKGISVPAGGTVTLLPIKSNTNNFIGKIESIYVNNSNLYVQLYNTTAGVVQDQDNTSGIKNWPIWSTYDYELRVYNSNSASAETGDIMITLQTIKPISF